VTRARSASVVACCGALVAGTVLHALSTQRLLSAAAIVHVAVEHPRAAPAAPADGRRPMEISTLTFAPWVLEPGLSSEDFEIVANGVVAPVASCEPASGPISLAIVLDASASMDQTVPAAWLPDTLKGLVGKAAQFGDRVVIGRVGGSAIRFSAGFVSGGPALTTAVRDILRPTDKDKASPLAGYEASPIWDAVDQAVGLLEVAPGRREVVLFTDGRSSANAHSLAEVAAHAAASSVGISVVSTAREEVILQSGATAARVRPGLLLEGLASSTGGAFIQVWQAALVTRFPPDEDLVKEVVGSVLARVLEEAHGGYQLSFFPPTTDVAAHSLRVRMTKPGLRVRAPSSYRVQPPARQP